MVEEVTDGVVTDSGAAVGAEETEKHSVSEEPVCLNTHLLSMCLLILLHSFHFPEY